MEASQQRLNWDWATLRGPLRLLLGSLALGFATAWLVAWAWATLVVPPQSTSIGAKFHRAMGDGSVEQIDTLRFQSRGIIRYLVVYRTLDAANLESLLLEDPLDDVDGWARPIVRPWRSHGQDWPDFPFPPVNDGVIYAIDVIAHGWPCECLYTVETCVVGASPNKYGADVRAITIKSVQSAKSRGTGRRFPEPLQLPYLPVWSGLCLNTAFYGSIWLSFLTVFMQLRRSLRHRRGLCPACAYDLRATPAGSPCPECGNVSPSRRTPT